MGMSTWTEMAKDSLEAAKELKEIGRIRSSLSRAYYSAYALITEELLRSGYTVSTGRYPNPAHEQLATMAKFNLDPARFSEQSRRQIGHGLRTLRQLRTAADYDPESS